MVVIEEENNRIDNDINNNYRDDIEKGFIFKKIYDNKNIIFLN